MVLVDMTTSEPSLAREIFETAKAKGVAAIDAPVSGGDVGAKNATLSIMVGGEADTIAAVKPLLECMGKTIVHQGPAGADYFYKQAGARKVYIIDDTETYGKGIADTFATEFQKLGGTVVGHKGLDKTTQDYKPAITEAVQLGADSIYFGGTDGDGGTKCRVQMVTVPGAANLPFGGGDGLETDSFLTTTAQANASGAVVTVASVNADKLASAADFKTAFAKEYSDPAAYGAYSANAYDAANIMIQAIKKALDGGAVTPKDGSDLDGAKTFRQAVIDQIAKIDYNGVTGHTTFDSNGDTTNKVISIYKSGKTSWDFVAQFNVG